MLSIIRTYKCPEIIGMRQVTQRKMIVAMLLTNKRNSLKYYNK